MKLRGMKYKVLQVPAFSSYLSSLNLYFYVLTLSVYDVGFGRFHILIIFSILACRSDYPVPGKPHSFSHHIKFAQVPFLQLLNLSLAMIKYYFYVSVEE